MSVPNQKKIIIHKPERPLFLMVGRDDVLSAPKLLDQPCAIALYLYLACNKDGYPFELSQVAYSNATGFGRSSYYRAISNLKEKGYIYEDNCGRLNFATSPKTGNRTQCQCWEEDESEQTQNSNKSDTQLSQNGDKSVSEVNREIKIIENNKKDKKKENSYPSTLEGLKEIISPLGEYDGKWLEDEVEGLWSFTNFAMVGQIVRNTDFTVNQADIIAYKILDPEARGKYKRTDLNGILKYGT